MFTSHTTNAGRKKPSFQTMLSPTSGRRGRMETTIQLRKSKKDDLINKRRNLGTVTNNNNNNNNNASSSAAGLVCTDVKATIERLVNTLLAWQANPLSVNIDMLTGFVRDVRRLTLEEGNDSIPKLLQSGAIHYLVLVLKHETHPSLLHEVIWVFVNLTASDDKAHLNAVCQSDVVYELGRLCCANTNATIVREQAAWCIGNIAADSKQRRDWLYSIEGIIPGMQQGLANPQNDAFLSTIAFAVSNLVHGGTWEQIRRFFPCLCRALEECLKRGVKARFILDLVWSISYCTENLSNEELTVVCNTGVAKSLVAVLSRKEYNWARSLKKASIRSLGNFAAGSDEMTDRVVAAGFFDIGLSLLQSASRTVRRETCWALSNMATGERRIKAFVRHHEFVKHVIILASDGPYDVKQEAIYALTNAVNGCRDRDAHVLVQLGVLRPFCLFLNKLGDPKLTLEVLAAVKKLLQINEATDFGYKLMFEELHGIDGLEQSQEHPNEDVSNEVVSLIETFFEVEECDDQNVAPNANDSTFDFGILPSKQLFPSKQEAYSFGGSSAMNTTGD